MLTTLTNAIMGARPDAAGTLEYLAWWIVFAVIMLIELAVAVGVVGCLVLGFKEGLAAKVRDEKGKA